MKYNPILACISREVDDIELEDLDEPDNIITAKCIVSFRTSSSYTGDYGFDWLRKGDSCRRGDKCYTKIIDRNKRKSYIISKYKTPVFVKDIKEYDKFANKEFKSLIIPWKNRKKSIYSVPVMSLLKGKSATLNLKIRYC